MRHLFRNVCVCFSVCEEYFAPHYLAEIRHDLSQTTQRLAILEFAHAERLAVDEFLELQASSRRSARVGTGTGRGRYASPSLRWTPMSPASCSGASSPARPLGGARGWRGLCPRPTGGIRADPVKFEAEYPLGETAVQSLLWLKVPCLFTSDFPGAASNFTVVIQAS